MNFESLNYPRPKITHSQSSFDKLDRIFIHYSMIHLHNKLYTLNIVLLDHCKLSIHQIILEWTFPFRNDYLFILYFCLYVCCYVILWSMHSPLFYFTLICISIFKRYLTSSTYHLANIWKHWYRKLTLVWFNSDHLWRLEFYSYCSSWFNRVNLTDIVRRLCVIFIGDSIKLAFT